MVSLRVVLVAAALATALVSYTPSRALAACGDSWHAHCQLVWTFPTNTSSAVCGDLYMAIVSNLKDCCSDETIPAQNRHYVLTSATANPPSYSIAGKMHWPNGYIDDQEFTLTQGAGGCTVQACSHSESLSYYDYDGNYCNLRNLIRGTPFDSSLSEAIGSDGCRFRPASNNITAVCNQY